MSLISKIFSGGADAIVKTVSDTVDRFITTPDEKAAMKAELEKEINRHMEAIQAQGNEIEKAYLESIASAQDMNIHVQESDKSSWMAKNLAYIMDLLITVTWIGLTTYLMLVMLNLVKSDNHADYTAVTAVWGAVTGVFTQVLSFHRGSSQGSSDKQRLLDKMISKK